MKFTFIFKEALQLPRFVDVESESIESVTTKDIPEEFLSDMVFLYGVVDYSRAITVPAVISGGKIVQIPDGNYGELTPVEYFATEAEERE